MNKISILLGIIIGLTLIADECTAAAWTPEHSRLHRYLLAKLQTPRPVDRDIDVVNVTMLLYFNQIEKVVGNWLHILM
jgi:hypothetical protein